MHVDYVLRSSLLVQVVNILRADEQTIAESLNTKCRGRAWVFVTSQEDMDKVLGDRTKQQGSDFSKIQARFKTRLKLTSADVEEVIRKRLLEKNDAGTAVLGKIYADQHANFKTLFDFVVGVFRWWLRVAAYGLLLTTDRYPPFSLDA